VFSAGLLSSGWLGFTAAADSSTRVGTVSLGGGAGVGDGAGSLCAKQVLDASCKKMKERKAILVFMGRL
jgi:hypothetical protein